MDEQNFPRLDDISKARAGNNSQELESPPGWLFVLPWSLEQVGGVNEVVKNLILCFRKGGAFTPQLLLTNQKAKSRRGHGTHLVDTYYMNIWSPLSDEHPVASLRSFVLRFPYRCWTLLKIIKRHKVEVINPHFPELCDLLFVLMRQFRLFGGQVVLSIHGTDIRLALKTKGLERRLWKLLLRSADRIIVVSDDLGKEVLALEPKAAKQLVRIYNGVDVSLFQQQNDGPGARTSKATKTILSIGLSVSKKGHDTLVRALAHVVSKVPEAKLVIIGPQPQERESLQQLIDSLSLTDRVTTYNEVPHERVPEFFSQAAVFALASRAEGFGLVVIEAAAGKVPVVCTKATGLRELITDRVTGRLVKVNDHLALADAIIDVLTHPEEARVMAERLYDKVVRNFSWDQTYEDYLKTSSGFALARRTWDPTRQSA
jgi:glycosyltransferase involved in cell wall biosynthesis